MVRSGEVSRDIEPMSTKDVQGLFNGLDPEAVQLQCGSANRFFVCHVTPGTTLAGENFTFSTGHFMTVLHAGLFELVRTSP